MERVSWNWIDEEEPKPLAKVLARLRKQGAGVAPTVPALPVRAMARGGRAEGGPQRNSEGSYFQNAQNLEGTKTGGRRREEEEEEEEEEGFELAPPRKISKTPVTQPPTVAAIETMREDRMIAAIERLGRTVCEQREAKENSYGNMPENNFNNNFTRNTGNSDRGNDNRNNNNFQRNGNDNFNNFTHGQAGQNATNGGSGFRTNNFNPPHTGRQGNFDREDRRNFFTNRGGRSNFGDRNFSDRGGRSGGNRNFGGRSFGGRGAECRYKPCSDPECKLQHEQGQHKPDVEAYIRTATFRAHQKCADFHDTEQCTRASRGFCTRMHGRGNTQSTERCAFVGKGICEKFYSREGCPKSHRV